MSRSCERPGCSQPAAVVYGFVDTDGRLEVWLDAWSADESDRPWSGTFHGIVCQRHGDLLSPPQGWVLVDRREDVPRLFVPRPFLVYARGDDPSSPVGRTVDTSAELRRRRVVDLPTPQLFAENQVDDYETGDKARDVAELMFEQPVEPASSVDEESADGDARGDVRNDPREELSALLDASGPLLSRAFSKRNTGRDDPSRELMRPTHLVIDESA